MNRITLITYYYQLLNGIYQTASELLVLVYLSEAEKMVGCKDLSDFAKSQVINCGRDGTRMHYG